MEKKKLMFIMPSMRGGGAERVLINLLNLLDYNRYQVDLFVIGQKGQLWNEIPPMVNKVHAQFPSIFIKSISYILRWFHINLFGLFGVKVNGKYDVGIAFLDSIFTEVLFIKSLKLKKKITVIHSSYKTYSNRSQFIKGKYKDVQYKRYSKLDHIIAVSQESKKEFEELFGKEHPVEVIYNPFNISDIVEKAKEKPPLELTTGVLNFIAVGSLLPVKDFDLLIKASFILKEAGQRFHLHILGEGELQQPLEELIAELQMGNFVTLHGFKSNPYNWIKNADVFIMSSVVEGLPTVLCESLLLGKPVIVPNIPGCREVVDYGNYGIMVERDEKEFYKAMKSFILQPQLLEDYKFKAVERSKIFSDEAALAKYYNIFER